MPNAWILQTNAARIDVDGYLTERETAVWGCGAYGKRFALGDRAFLWRAAGGTGAEAGIVGLATIVELPELRGHDAPERCRDPKLHRPKLRVVVRLDEIRTAHPIPRAAVKSHPVLMRHPVVTVNQGCAFALSPEQTEALDELWTEFTG